MEVKLQLYLETTNKYLKTTVRRWEDPRGVEDAEAKEPRLSRRGEKLCRQIIREFQLDATERCLLVCGSAGHWEHLSRRSFTEYKSIVSGLRSEGK